MPAWWGSGGVWGQGERPSKSCSQEETTWVPPRQVGRILSSRPTSQGGGGGGE